MGQVQAVWTKLNANERTAGTGAIIILVSWVVGLTGYGFGTSAIALLGAVGVLAILYLKYTPNQSVTWPAPVPVMLFGISAVVGLFELLVLINLLSWFGILATYAGFALGYLIGALGTIVGAAIMVWGSYQEWQVSRTAA